MNDFVRLVFLSPFNMIRAVVLYKHSRATKIPNKVQLFEREQFPKEDEEGPFLTDLHLHT